ncbi:MULTISPECIES: CpsB/CapC family capsule biosynthesis tyrosine phosphatase [Olivibacter]|uniref:protein-tyrosine-phosphatase n=1 Tax=Olivibacter jilunii TaxID=985016 RepID=A0ABW6BA54_9SPHI
MLSFLRANTPDTLGSLLKLDICFDLYADKTNDNWLVELGKTQQQAGFEAILNVAHNMNVESIRSPNLPLPLHVVPLVGIKKDAASEIPNIQKTKQSQTYVFIETNRQCAGGELEDVIFRLELQGYLPILTQADRYTCLQDNYRNAKRLIDRGCLLHTNLLSLTGHQGTTGKRLAEKLLTDGLVSFFGTGIASNEGLQLVKSFKGTRKLLRVLANNPIKNSELLASSTL